MNYSRIILFTSCVDPNGMSKTVVMDKSQREEEYKRALQFYLDQTNYPIVVVDNSGYVYQAFQAAYPGRIETLSFEGNNFDRKLGKGYGEGLIIRYALEHSYFIRNTQCKFIYKISGRHILTNFGKLNSFMRFAEICSNKTVYAILKEKERWAVSDFFSGPVHFYRELIPYLEKCDDSRRIYFEHQLFQGITQLQAARCIRFIHLPLPLEQEGISGSTGKPLEKEGKASRFLLKSMLYFLHIPSMLTYYHKLK